MSKLEFKEFVKRNRKLISLVEKGETTWQKLYELYDLYGEKDEIWNKYLSNNSESNNLNYNIKDIINLIKKIDLNTVQKGLSSLDKAIDAFKDIIPSSKLTNINTYESSPTYKYYED